MTSSLSVNFLTFFQGRVFIAFAIISALLGPLIAVLYGAPSIDDYEIFTFDNDIDAGPGLFFLLVMSSIVGFLECVTGISAVILYCKMNPDYCSLCRINNQQVKNKNELKGLSD